MFNLKNKIYFAYFLTDIAIIIFSFFVPYIIRNNYELLLQLKFKNLIFPNLEEYIFIFGLWGILILSSLKRKHLFSTNRIITIPREVYSVLISLFYVSLIIASVIFFAQFKFFSRGVFIANFILLTFFLILWRIIKRLILRYLIIKGYHNFNVLIIGAGKVGKTIFEEFKNRPFLGLKFIGFIDDFKSDAEEETQVIGKISEFEKICKKYLIDEVFITIPSESEKISKILESSKKLNLGVHIVPMNFEDALPAININYLGFIPILTYKERGSQPTEFFIKKIFDFSVGLILIIFLFPLMLTIAILIKLDSPGPVFYMQKRIGRKGKIFKLYKFRSMVANADTLKEDLIPKNEVRGGVIFKLKEDPRRTKIGKILRRYSLDELPQLFNVLLGDMSLVGPRPFPVEETKKFDYQHMVRLQARPGIVGMAQVRGRSSLSFYKWVKWDLWYINNWSFGLDLRILWWTIPVVLKGKGAY